MSPCCGSPRPRPAVDFAAVATAAAATLTTRTSCAARTHAQDKRDAWSIEYDFAYGGASTKGLPREGEVVPYTPSDKEGTRDTPPGDYAKKVPMYDPQKNMLVHI